MVVALPPAPKNAFVSACIPLAAGKGRHQPHVDSHPVLMGLPNPRAILQYAESSKAKRNKKLLMGQTRILSALYKLHPPLTFRRSTFITAFRRHSMQAGWLTTYFHCTESEAKLWSVVSAKRLMAMCRHSKQALLDGRGRHCHWIQAVFFLSGNANLLGASGGQPALPPAHQEPSILLFLTFLPRTSGKKTPKKKTRLWGPGVE